MTEDEFTIARPRWIIPVALIGALLLGVGIFVSLALSGGDNKDVPPARTGGTVTLVETTTVVETTTTR